MLFNFDQTMLAVVVFVTLCLLASFVVKAWRIRSILKNEVRVEGTLKKVCSSGIGSYWHEYEYEFKVPGGSALTHCASIPSFFVESKKQSCPDKILLSYQKNKPQNSYPTEFLQRSYRSIVHAIAWIVILSIYCALSG